jgi:hypothetical protein
VDAIDISTSKRAKTIDHIVNMDDKQGRANRERLWLRFEAEDLGRAGADP